MISMCDRVILTATSTAMMLIQAMRGKPFKAMGFAGTTKPKACISAWPFPDMKVSVKATLTKHVDRIGRLQCKPVGGHHVPNSSQLQEAHDVAVRSQASKAAQRLLLSCFQDETLAHPEPWMATASTVFNYIAKEVQQPYMKPLRDWVLAALEATSAGDYHAESQLVHLIVNIISHAGQSHSTNSRTPFMRFLAKDDRVYCINWTDLSAKTWNLLQDTALTRLECQALLSCIAWKPSGTMPLNQSNYTESVWPNASRVLNLYEQGVTGEALLNTETLDDVRPATRSKRSRSGHPDGDGRASWRPQPGADAQGRPPLPRQSCNLVI